MSAGTVVAVLVVLGGLVALPFAVRFWVASGIPARAMRVLLIIGIPVVALLALMTAARAGLGGLAMLAVWVPLLLWLTGERAGRDLDAAARARERKGEDRRARRRSN